MSKTSHRTIGRMSLMGCLLGLLSIQAQAQTSPWYLGINQRLEHQNNVYQASSGQQADTISITSLIGGFDIPVSRQQLFGRATVSANRYQNRSVLNNNSYNAQLGLNWETAGNIAGTVALDTSKSLADFNPFGLGAVTDNNGLETSGARATARFGLVTRLSGEVGISARRTRYDNPLYVARNLDIEEAFAGVRYRPAGTLVLGAALRRTLGEYPRFRNPAPGAFTPEGFEGNNFDLTAEWPVSGASRIDARASFGETKYDTLTAGNFDGLTGAVTWIWKPTGRTGAAFGFTRTAGDQTSLNTVPGRAVVATSISQVADTLFGRVDYDLTGKIKATAGLAYSDTNTLNLAAQTTGKERLTTANLGLVWEATRSIRAGCDVVFRTATRAGAPGYDANNFGCFGEFLLR
jgi:hypothetical protein